MAIFITGSDEGRIAAHQGVRQPLEKLPCCHSLVKELELVAKGLVTVMSRAPFLPSDHLLIRTSSGFKENLIVGL